MNSPAQHGQSSRRRSRRSPVVSYLGVGVAAFVLGGAIAPRRSAPAPASAAGVTGIGGIFFKSEDPDALRAWYRAHLGIESAAWGGYPFLWEEKDRPGETGYTVWAPFPDSTNYFAPGEHDFMINYRVADLAGLITALRAAGVTIVGDIEQHPNGAFAWVLDLEGRKIELWQPVPSQDDPYLR